MNDKYGTINGTTLPSATKTDTVKSNTVAIDNFTDELSIFVARRGQSGEKREEPPAPSQVLQQPDGGQEIVQTDRL
jgi:hypothetical protein